MSTKRKAAKQADAAAVVTAVTLELADGRKVTIHRDEISPLIVAGNRWIQARDAGQPLPETRFSRDIETLEQIARVNGNHPMLALTSSVMNDR
jgi:hypothetical protein